MAVPWSNPPRRATWTAAIARGYPRCYFYPMAKPDRADPVRAALEEGKRRPLPPPEERERILAVVRERANGPWMTTEEHLAMVATRRAAAAE